MRPQDYAAGFSAIVQELAGRITFSPALQYRSDIVHGLLGLGLYIFPHCLVSLGIEGAGSRYVDMSPHTTLF